MSDLHKLIDQLPKAELHLHLEGSLEPELMFTLAERNQITLPYSSVDEIRKAYSFNNLQEFLDLYYAGMSVLQTEQDFFALTQAYLEKARGDNVKHVEVFFDPQAHTERGLPFSVAITGIKKALLAAQSEHGMSYRLIMCFLRHLSEEHAFIALEQAKDYLPWIDGVGLDSSELGHPPEKFKAVFTAAKKMKLKCVAHAGEEGPPHYVEQALNLLKINRLDHGNRAMEDPGLIERLKKEQIALTVCPLSNLKLAVIEDMAQHPALDMLNQGLLVTINSDDPSYFGGYVNDNYKALTEALDLEKHQVVQLAKNSFIGSFLDNEDITAYLKEIDRLAQLHLPPTES